MIRKLVLTPFLSVIVAAIPLVFSSMPAQASSLVPVYRLVDNTTMYADLRNMHLLTIDQNEYNTLTTGVVDQGVTYSWKSETPTFQAYAASGGVCASGTEPVYRLYAGWYYTDHLLTADTTEVTFWASHGYPTWVNEGVAFCAYSTQVAGTVPVYRILRSDGHEHFLTADQNEEQTLVANGWGKLEGIAFYANP